MTTYERQAFFNAVRGPLFGGRLSQQQVDGMSFKLAVWEKHHDGQDPRWLAYALATSKHETASTMWPVEEYGKGSGHEYGKPVKETGKAYYGRGDVQLTWDYNYKNASARLGLSGENDLYWHPEKALDPRISADVMFTGMAQGWFRSGHSLPRYFSDTNDDAYNARDIINGDKKTVPSWSGGQSIGTLISGYYSAFYEALAVSATDDAPQPTPEPPAFEQVTIDIEAPEGIMFHIRINGQSVALS
jgi:putative chitinase